MQLRFFELWVLKFISLLGGCLTCFYFQSQWGFNPVTAAALTGLIGSFIPDTKKIESAHIHATVYIGAFIAMGSKVVMAGFPQILFVSILGTTIYFFISPYIKGFGGRMGFVAFISSILGFALRNWL
ncbi:hypothetical protein [Bdellovibrio reynosensis]|uniref:HPP family protein n=1 Tax=Bdellovibrio reynosensis TaxID=2835041 RepID=A0ABY4C970_9BACT|nr:hypothetical protein [Bdellovibrio reynosensis]UOF01537.1 hypothetical protein MNR06_01035 [Bdellovibrio reynosensis]